MHESLERKKIHSQWPHLFESCALLHSILIGYGLNAIGCIVLRMSIIMQSIGLHPISSENSLVHTLFVEFCLLVVVTAPEAAQEADSAMCLAAGVLPGVRRTR